MKAYKTVLFIGISLILIFSPIARGAVRVWSVTPVLLALYTAIFLWLFKAINIGRKSEVGSRKVKALNLPIALFTILATTSFAFSIYKHDSLYALLRLFAYIGLYYLIVNEFDHRMRKRLIWVVISIGSCLSAYGLLQYFGLFDKSWWYPPQFVAATYVNHNHFAGLLELIIPVTAAILIGRKTQDARRKTQGKTLLYKLCLAVALVLMAAVFLLTQSRGAWISLGTSMAIMLVCMIKTDMTLAKKSVLIVCMLMAALTLLYFSKDVVTTRLETMSGIEAGEDVSGGRLKIWQGALGMIKNHPLIGVGIGDFDQGFYRYRPIGLNVRAVYAHNDYLQAAAEMGIFAPILMVWIFTTVVIAGLKVNENPYSLGCAAGVLSLSLHGVVDFNFHIPANMIVFVIWIGIVTGESCAKRT